MHLFVILFTGEYLGKVHPRAGTHPQAGTPPGQTNPPPGDTLSGQASPARCMLGYGQQADGTHPTGMHSCDEYYLPSRKLLVQGAIQRYNTGKSDVTKRRSAAERPGSPVPQLLLEHGSGLQLQTRSHWISCFSPPPYPAAGSTTNESGKLY